MTGTPAEMTCQELVELVTEYLEGTLPPVERQRFEQHLGTCDGCSAYLDQMRRTVHMLSRMTADDISAQEQAKLLELFRDWRRAGT